MTFTVIEWTEEKRPWRGEFEGAKHESGVSVIFNHMERPGLGPALHRHPYSETFIIRRGSVEFTDGKQKLVAHTGQIVVVGPNVPHAFVGLGEPPIEMLDIHASAEIITEWL